MRVETFGRNEFVKCASNLGKHYKSVYRVANSMFFDLKFIIYVMYTNTPYIYKKQL